MFQTSSTYNSDTIKDSTLKSRKANRFRSYSESTAKESECVL